MSTQCRNGRHFTVKGGESIRIKGEGIYFIGLLHEDPQSVGVVD